MIKMDSLDQGTVLTWEDAYAIALALRRLHPEVSIEDVSLQMIYRWTVEIPIFGDDPGIANEAILASIFQEWFEEANQL